MKHFFVFITLLLVAGFQFSHSQNLVVNPSFEITNTNCSNPFGEGYRSDLDPSWDNANNNIPGDSCSSPDLFSACNPIATGMPDATGFGIGWQYSRTGTRHVGIITYSAPFGFADNYREYIQGQTSTPLVAGQTYCVSFYVSLADGSPWAVSELDVYFSNTRYLRNACTQGSRISVTPQLTNNCGIISDTANWVRLQWDYVATGGEQFFVIGNFNTDGATDKAPASGSGFGNYFAYYFIDDVSIIANPCCYAQIPNRTACVSDAPFNLTASPGVGCGSSLPGTWTGTGITNPSSGTFSPSVAGPGTHTITFTATCGFVATTTVVVSPCAMQVCTESNGSLTVSGGTNPYTWSYFQPGGTVQITNQAQCTACGYTWQSFVGQCLNGFMPATSCTTADSWVQFATGTNIPAPTTYPIQVSDGAGSTLSFNTAGSIPSCSANPCATVTITAAITPTHATCTTPGSAIATPSGGTGPYTYSWNTTPAQTNATATGLTAGSYTVTVTDANGCTGTQSVTINAAAQAPTVTTASTNAGCNGVLGTATATVTGGTSPYSYSWNTTPAQTNATATGLAAGNYTVTVTDAGGCITTQNVTVGQTSGLSVSVSGVNVSCNGGSNGSATATPTGGTPTYTYVWSPSGGNAATATGLAAGTYTVNVTDVNGCTAQGSVQITQPAAATITMSSTQTQCLVNSGTATAAISGGQSPYSYSWNTTPVQTSATATGLAAGNYTVTVTDANNCQTTGNVLVGAVNAPTISVVSSQDVSCFGDVNGAAQVTATGGTPNYTYTWSPGNLTGASVSNLAPGTYTATVVDNAGCTNLIQVTINEPDALVVTESVVHANCGVDDGEISLTVTGGTGIYTYGWTPNVSTTNSATGLAIGNYTIDVTDAMGCTESVSVIVTTNTTFAIDVTPNVATVNPGGSIGLDLEVEPGIVVSTITWTPAGGLSCTDCDNPVASPTQTTTYYVIVESDNGCISTDSVVIIIQDPCGELFVPTIFSPNDDGLNDLECVMGSCVIAIDFTIYNRWGEAVFITTERDECWDGNFRGKPAQTGVYVYKLKAILDNGQTITQSGNINLTR
jgi:gliding motility-associated-like protein